MTKGPWTAEDCRVLSDALSVAVCITWDRNDAPLISAAPELYEACSKVLAGVDDVDDYVRIYLSAADFAALRAALAKAEFK